MIASTSGSLPELGPALASLFLLWVAIVFLGFAIGASTKNTGRANSIPQILSYLLGFLSPVYYPLKRLPTLLQPIALLIPTTHAAQLAKAYLGLLTLSPFETLISWAYLLGFAVVMGIVAVRRAHWMDP